MRVLLFLLVSLLAGTISASDLKLWEDGPLEWSDFKGTPNMLDSKSSIKVYLTIRSRNVASSDNKENVTLVAEAVMVRDMSVADSSQRTEQRLRYHQLQFDMLEGFRRQLQNEINAGLTGIDADERLRTYTRRFAESVEDMNEQTNYGSNDPKLQEWEYYARRKLDEIGLPPEPKVELAPFSYGFFLGTGMLWTTSSLHDAFSGSWTFTAGLQLGYRRLRLRADIGYSQPKLNRENIMGIPNQSITGTYASHLASSIALGCAIVDTKRFTVSPYFGCTWSAFQWNLGNYEEIDDEMKLTSVETRSIHDWNWYAAIDFDIKFYTTVSQSTFFLTGHHEQYTSSIRISPYVSHVAFDTPVPALSGYQVGITVAYSGLARSLRIR